MLESESAEPAGSALHEARALKATPRIALHLACAVTYESNISMSFKHSLWVNPQLPTNAAPMRAEYGLTSYLVALLTEITPDQSLAHQYPCLYVDTWAKRGLSLCTFPPFPS